LIDPAQMVKKDVREKQNKFVYRTVLTVLVSVLIGLSVTRVVLANILATSGQRLSAVNQKIEILVEQNQKLENQISALGSLARIEENAQKAGFIKAENVQILVPGSPIANR